MNNTAKPARRAPRHAGGDPKAANKARASRGAAIRSLLAGLAAAAMAALAPAAAPAAVELHAFDPVLSLRGDCGTDAIDSVADPGCPAVHAPSRLSEPQSVETDAYGNVYVSNVESKRIDVFKPNGEYITGVSLAIRPRDIAVDGDGNLYLFSIGAGIRRFEPTGIYDPAAGEIEYADPPVTPPDLVADAPKLSDQTSIVVNPENDHLFVDYAVRVREYGSASEENERLDESIGFGQISTEKALGLAIDATRDRLYVTASVTKIKVFELQPPHALIETIDLTTTPIGAFVGNRRTLAVDEGTGHIFLYDTDGAEKVFELTETGAWVSTITYALDKQAIDGGEIAIDNGPQSPNGALNPLGRYLYVPAFPAADKGRLLAFGPFDKCAPEIEGLSVDHVTEREARLRATVNPCNVAATYALEYTTEAQFEAEGFEGAKVAGQGELPASKNPFDVAATATGLEPDTAYRFRLVAENEIGPSEAQAAFRTYPQAAPFAPCANDALRIGPSSALPDCRAYELVTPPATNSLPPLGQGTGFGGPKAAPSGDRVSFNTEGGSLPDYGGTGSFNGDAYRSTRSATGWFTERTGPEGAEAPNPIPGNPSADQRYYFWTDTAARLRFPDGHIEPVGTGSLGTDLGATLLSISQNGEHVIFSGDEPLEENAPPAGIQAVYDRTPGGATHVVSLLPGEITPGAGQSALLAGYSTEGDGIAFRIGSTLYLRHRNEVTHEIGNGLTFAGITDGGGRIFYLQGGDLKAFDVETGTIVFSTGGDAVPVNVSADGSTAYFVSTDDLGGGANPEGDEAQAGEQNLYLSREGALSFLAKVTERDVEGVSVPGQANTDGLGLLTEAIGNGKLGVVPARSTPDGSVLLFSSRASLTGYDSEGHPQVYRYDEAASTLACLSCDPTGAPASGDGRLQSSPIDDANAPLDLFAYTANLSPDGNRALFESDHALLSRDTDGLRDVYEWEAQGVGSCKEPDGCTYLISSTQSARPEYLYGASTDGRDIFIWSSELLSAEDADETPSVYDARVLGGFPAPAIPPGECLGEACQPTTPVPGDPAPVIGGAGNVVQKAKPKPRCPKGKRRVRRAGKSRCIAPQQKKQRKRGANANRRQSR